MNCWQVLGIKPTNNLKVIKKAYAAKSREVHPEEHPEEFRLLHDSYETAPGTFVLSTTLNILSFLSGSCISALSAAAKKSLSSVGSVVPPQKQL